MIRILIRKTVLAAAPHPPARRTLLCVAPTAGALTYGLYSGTLAPGSDMVTIDWGDGIREMHSGFSQLTHTYAKEGTYAVSISDDLSVLGCSGPVGPVPHTRIYARLLTKVVSDAVKLTALNTGAFRQSENLIAADFSKASITTLSGNVFYGCSALSGSIHFPCVTEIVGSGSAQPFSGCSSLREIHFSAANESVITELTCYKDDPKLGAVNAKVIFDLS